MRLSWQLMVFCTIALWADSALAQRQPIPDDTLGGERSVVTPSNNLPVPGDRISGGARRGDNLFHSFREFGVDVGRSVYFEDPGVRNILSRVTGGNPSEIFGRLGVLGNANLFLINPSGIVFGAGATLDVRGSFVGTTANGIQFGNQGFFSASEPNAPPLLTVQPSAFLFNRTAAQPIQPIVNRSIAPSLNDPRQLTGLQVQAGRSLLLVGGDVRLEGGRLRAPGGRVELAGLQESGQIGLVLDGNTLSLDVPTGISRADVFLSRGAQANVQAADGGTIVVNTQNLTIEGISSLQAGIAANSGSSNSQAGDIDIGAIDSVTLTGAVSTSDGGQSTILNRVERGSTGQAGNINITTGRLLVANGAELNTRTLGRGNAGNININVREAVFKAGQRFNNNLNDFESSRVVSGVQGSAIGQAGDINITATDLFSVTDGALLSASSISQGNSGNITIIAPDVQLDGTGSDNLGGIYSQILGNGTGQGGNIVIAAESLSLTNGATLTTNITGKGQGGNIRVTASNEVRVSGAANRDRLSSLSAQTLGGSDAGNILIRTGSLLIEGGGQVLTASDSSNGGNAGDITISATNQVQVSGESLLRQVPNGDLLSRLTTRTRGAGNAGDLSIATDHLVIEGGAQVATANNSRRATGNAGNLTINADRIDIRGASAIESGNGILLSRLVSRTDGMGNAGDLRITTRVLNIEDGAQVSSGTNSGIDSDTEDRTSTGNGGLLSIRASDQVRVRGTSPDRHNVSRLTARTDGTGEGGTLIINTGRLLVEAGGQVSAGSLNRGQAGTLTINADREVRVSGSIIQPPSATNPRGDEISSRIATRAEGTGSAGNLNIHTDRLVVSAGGQITADTFTDAVGGTLSINADQIQVSGRSPRGTRSGLLARTSGTGTAGALRISTERLRIQNGGQVSVSGGKDGNAGRLQVTARTLALENQGRLTAETVSGSGGDVALRVSDSLSLTNQSEISASTQSGQGGSVILNGLERLQASDSRISASAHTGRAGNVSISASDSTQLRNGSQLSVEARRLGTAGNLQVTTGYLSVDRSQITVSNPNGRAGSLAVTADVVQLNRGRLRADIGGNASGANIDLQLDGTRLLMQNGSRISAIAADNARGGNVTVNAANGFVVASPEDNDIRASALQGRGGDIQISAQGIFGLEERRSIAGNGTSDIDASSDFGTAGTVAINRLDPDPAQGLVELSIAPIDASNQIAQNCPIDGELGAFVITGRGGVPSNPAELLGGETVLTDLAETEGEAQESLRSQEQTADRLAVSPVAKTEIVEAQGWVMGADGKVRLTTDNPTVELHLPPIAPVLCPSS